MRTLTLYRDDSTVQVVFENVKHFFWTANNTVLTIAQITDPVTGAHKYIHWPRERFCWFKDSGSSGSSVARIFESHVPCLRHQVFGCLECQ